ncbi:hypothetical protein GTR02_03615 [Kineococcus sp. R8]|uniref:hypothetical protein n=1 Tax=Kineococcus siccus TaxID=2696567 RepID=UPI0014136474|nr:hypothetical protein [Kineococcus siccus]NAZ80904.1 hypothetical protein [Kineococcus siccus]
MSPSRRRTNEPRSGRTRGRLVFTAVVLAGALLVFAVLQGFGRLFDSQGLLDASVTAALIVLIGTPLNVWVGTAVTGRVRRHLAATDRMECSFRVVEGHQDGLTGRWRPGIATLSPGKITFVRMIGGLRFLKGRPTTFAVQTCASDPPRKLRGVEALLVKPDAQAVRLTTTTAVLECAITPTERIGWALQQLEAAPSTDD